MTHSRSLLVRSAALAGVTALAFASLAGCSGSDGAADSGANASAQTDAGAEGDLGGIISAEEVKDLMDNGEDFVLLDVRSPEEFAAQHIDGAENLNVEDITADTAAQAIGSTDAKVVLYCRSGHRAGIAMQALLGLGYTDVASMGAISDWPYGYVEG